MPGPIPQPPKNPPPSSIAAQPPLGNIFGVRSDAFNRYMELIGIHDTDALEILEDCVGSAEERAHPLAEGTITSEIEHRFVVVGDALSKRIDAFTEKRNAQWRRA